MCRCDEGSLAKSAGNVALIIDLKKSQTREEQRKSSHGCKKCFDLIEGSVAQVFEEAAVPFDVEMAVIGRRSRDDSWSYHQACGPVWQRTRIGNRDWHRLRSYPPIRFSRRGLRFDIFRLLRAIGNDPL